MEGVGQGQKKFIWQCLNAVLGQIFRLSDTLQIHRIEETFSPFIFSWWNAQPAEYSRMQKSGRKLTSSSVEFDLLQISD